MKTVKSPYSPASPYFWFPHPRCKRVRLPSLQDGHSWDNPRNCKRTHTFGQPRSRYSIFCCIWFFCKCKISSALRSLVQSELPFCFLIKRSVCSSTPESTTLLWRQSTDSSGGCRFHSRCRYDLLPASARRKSGYWVVQERIWVWIWRDWNPSPLPCWMSSGCVVISTRLASYRRCLTFLSSIDSSLWVDDRILYHGVLLVEWAVSVVPTAALERPTAGDVGAFGFRGYLAGPLERSLRFHMLKY